MLNRFQKWAIATTLCTYFLIMVGAFVRAAGAGMGCPDWPQCFDRWIPPTDVSQLPPTIDPALFNVTLAWIEYVNRLLGVATGIFIFVALILAIRHYRKVPRVLWPTVGAFVGVAFEGWLGSQVVKYELEPSIVTAHLVVALGVVSLLQYATVCAFFPEGRPLAALSPARRRLGQASLGVLALLGLQFGLGAFLRGELERVAALMAALPRGQWISQAGPVDPLHRLLGFGVALGVVLLFLWVRKSFRQTPWLVRSVGFCLAVVAGQLVAGIALTSFALPPFFQVAHVLLASLLLGGLSALTLLAWRLPEPAPASA